MAQRKIYHNIVFIYKYLALVFIPLLYIVLTQGSAAGLLFYIIAIAVLYLLVRFQISLGRKKKEMNRDERCHGIFGALALAAATFFPVEAADGGFIVWLDIAGTVLTGCGLLSIFAVYLYAGYYYEKYLTMYENPCVSGETIRRFEQNTAAVLKKKALVFAVTLAVMYTVLSIALSGQTVSKPKKREIPKVEQEKTDVPDAVDHVRERLNEKKEKEEEDPAWEMFLLILRKVLWVIVVLLALLGAFLVIFFIFRRILSLQPLPLSDAPKKEEIITEGTDEYIPLRPVYREREKFPADNNGKIRRYFYHYIRKKAGSGVDISLTPFELAEAYGTEGSGQLSEGGSAAVRIYEKARYSGKMCGDEEVEEVRKQL